MAERPFTGAFYPLIRDRLRLCLNHKDSFMLYGESARARAFASVSEEPPDVYRRQKERCRVSRILVRCTLWWEPEVFDRSSADIRHREHSANSLTRVLSLRSMGLLALTSLEVRTPRTLVGNIKRFVIQGAPELSFDAFYGVGMRTHARTWQYGMVITFLLEIVSGQIGDGIQAVYL
jgi:hypothetical protein